MAQEDMSTKPASGFRGLDVLAQMQGDAPVRVVLRASERKATLDVLKPADFSNFTDYRKALIQRHRLAYVSEKAKIEALATSMGLSAHSASTVNAVTVEGSAGTVLAFLRSTAVMNVVLDCSLDVLQTP